MVTQKPRIKLTYEDYRTTPEDKRYELLDGELILAPAPRTSHQSVQIALGSRMYRFVEAEGLGQVFLAPTDVVLSDTDVVQPDILFVSRERAHIITEDNIQDAPDMVIEILSPGTADRDRGFKRALYARHGVREYWLVGPDSATVTVLALEEEGFEVVGTYGEGDSVSSSVVEGLTVELDEIFGL